MTCCKCQEFGWDHPADTVWKDSEGQKYCIFHAPENRKGVGVHEFNKIVCDAMKEAAAQEKTCELSGAIFPGNIFFSPRVTGENLPDIGLYGAEFYGSARFARYNGAGYIDLALAHFSKILTFSSCVFDKSLDFYNIVCDGPVRFSDCKFKSDEAFNNATFNSEVTFDKCKFSSATDFSSSTFKNNATISNTIFNNYVKFNRAQLYGSTKIIDTIFVEIAMFEDVDFFGRAYFLTSNFLKKAKFCRALFAETAQFTRCKTGDEIIDFQDIQILSKLSFSLMDMRSSNFLFVKLDNIDFQNARWEKALDESRYLVVPEKNDATCIDQFDCYVDSEVILRGVIDFYRQMKKKSREKLDDEEVSLWHCAEKETQLKLLRQQHVISFQRIILEIYRVVSRFGEDPRQAAEVLFYLLLGLLAALALGGLQSLGEPPYDLTAARIANGLRAFAQYTLFMKPDWSPPGIFDVVAIFLSRLIIPIQATIFAFALRNKLHR